MKGKREMKKRFGIKAGFLGLAILAAGAVTAAPAIAPQTALAAETNTASTQGMYEIVRKINIFYVNEDGSTESGGSAAYKGYVSNENMSFTFPEIKVADLFKDGLGFWKPDRDTIPEVTATCATPPAEENIYLSLDKSRYIEESKTINRTVNYYYVDANGKKSTAGRYSDSVTFKRPGYVDDKGNNIYNDWSGEYTFKEIAVPEKNGYTANMTVVPAKTVTPFDSDYTVEVLYSKIPTRTESKEIKRKINYVYKDSNFVFKTITQKATISREVYTDQAGKTVVVRDWNSGKFSAHTVENVTGYTSDKKTVEAAAYSVSVTPADVNVYFTKEEDPFTGAKWVNGVLKYFENGIENNTFTGITITAKGNKVYFKDGVFQNNFTGVIKDKHGKELLFKKGIFANDFSNAKWIDGVLIYFENGVKNTTVTGIVPTEKGNMVYFKKGVFQKSFNGKYGSYTIKRGIVVN